MNHCPQKDKRIDSVQITNKQFIFLSPALKYDEDDDDVRLCLGVLFIIYKLIEIDETLEFINYDNAYK